MGAFVLGILVGWLAEWLFYTFYEKSGGGGDSSNIKAELELKERQIKSLQTQLASALEGTQVKSTAQPAKAKSSEKAATKTAVKTPKATTKNSAKSTDNKTNKKPKAKAGGDDFTKLTGIGPSMSATLKSIGVDTFEKLAATDDDELREKLEASGARMNNNKDAMESWNEQATIAATGDFKALKAMQETLKS